jgi:hypothetical protein
MPDTVWTIEVWAATGMTYRAVSIAFFSASRSTFFRRLSEAPGVRWRRSERMRSVSCFRRPVRRR